MTSFFNFKILKKNIFKKLPGTKIVLSQRKAVVLSQTFLSCCLRPCLPHVLTTFHKENVLSQTLFHGKKHGPRTIGVVNRLCLTNPYFVRDFSNTTLQIATTPSRCRMEPEVVFPPQVLGEGLAYQGERPRSRSNLTVPFLFFRIFNGLFRDCYGFVMEFQVFFLGGVGMFRDV